jgi:hypothetical protein
MEPIKISSEYHLIRNELRSPVGKEALTKQMNLPTSLFAESILLAQQDPPFRLGVRYSLARCISTPFRIAVSLSSLRPRLLNEVCDTRSLGRKRCFQLRITTSPRPALIRLHLKLELPWADGGGYDGGAERGSVGRLR